MKPLEVFGNKKQVFLQVAKYLQDAGLSNYTKDDRRPWGGFFVIDEKDTMLFLNTFYPEVVDQMDMQTKLSPKILIVEKQMRLSWQYHHRRSELWKLICGQAQIVRSSTNLQSTPAPLVLDKIVTLDRRERHRLIGCEDWGVVAEIWKHTDINNPSDEDDIFRLQDDFGRGHLS